MEPFIPVSITSQMFTVTMINYFIFPGQWYNFVSFFVVVCFFLQWYSFRTQILTNCSRTWHAYFLNVQSKNFKINIHGKILRENLNSEQIFTLLHTTKLENRSKAKFFKVYCCFHLYKRKPWEHPEVNKPIGRNIFKLAKRKSFHP